MGARWAWSAVCPNLHVYSNFSGGADPCYTCGGEPEVEFNESDIDGAAEAYAQKRKTMTPEQILTANEVGELHRLAAKHGYALVTRA